MIMKNGIRITLLILSTVLILSELIYGIPFLGGSLILSFGWQPLLINIFLYFALDTILFNAIFHTCCTVLTNIRTKQTC